MDTIIFQLDLADFLLTDSGLTWDHLKDVIRAQIGAGNFAAIEQVADLVSTLDANQLNPSAMYDFLADLPNRLGSQFNDLLGTFNWTTMLNSLVNTAKDQLVNSLAQILPRLAAKFIPGIGILASIYDGIKFLLDNADRLGGIVSRLIDSIGDLVASVADPSKVEAFADRIASAVSVQGLDVVLGFAADQLGLQHLPTNIRNFIRFIPNVVDDAMRRAVSALASQVTRLLPGGNTGLYAGLVGERRDFSYRNHNYTLWVARPRNGVPQVKVAEGPRLIAVLTTAMFNNTIRSGATGRLAAIDPLARSVTNATSINAANQFLPGLTAAENATIADITGNACSALSCFAAGTKLWTPDGYRTIESILPGELIYSRDEFDPEGAIEAMHVEEVFRRFAPILNLHLNGQVIRTTGEHPFFVYNKGWTKAAALQPWDCLLSADGQWIAVEEVFDTGEWEIVYNLRIADFHTYFVGDWNWDFAVWAHNTCSYAAWIAAHDNDIQVARTNRIEARNLATTSASSGAVAVANSMRTSSRSSPPTGFINVSAEDVRALAQSITSDWQELLPPDTRDGNNWAGYYNACHAELKQLVLNAARPIGVSFNVCGNCQEFFRRFAIARGITQILAAGSLVFVFFPDGHVQQV